MIETVLHYHWRIIVHTLRHYRQVQIDEYLTIKREGKQFIIVMAPKIEVYMEKKN